MSKQAVASVAFRVVLVCAMLMLVMEAEHSRFRTGAPLWWAICMAVACLLCATAIHCCEIPASRPRADAGAP